jgi:hypothetical protein
MESKERLRKAVDFIKSSTKDKTNAAISKRLRYRSLNYVADMLGGSKEINPVFLDKLSSEYSINKKWIIEGSGVMILPKDSKSVVSTGIHEELILVSDSKTFEKEKKIPVYESAPATLSNIESYRDEPHAEPDFYLSIPQYRHCDMITRARGDSMHPLIRNMALVGGKRIYDFNVVIFGDIYIVHTSNGIETIKYVHPHESDPEQVLLVPYNGNAKSTPIHKSEIIRIYQAQFVLNPL